MQSDPRVRFRSAGRSPGRSACPHWRRSTESRVAEPPDALRKWRSYVNLDRHFCRHCCQSPRRDAEPPENWPTLNLNQPHFENDQPVVLITEEFVRLDVIVEMKLGASREACEAQHVVAAVISTTTRCWGPSRERREFRDTREGNSPSTSPSVASGLSCKNRDEPQASGGAAACAASPANNIAAEATTVPRIR